MGFIKGEAFAVFTFVWCISIMIENSSQVMCDSFPLFLQSGIKKIGLFCTNMVVLVQQSLLADALVKTFLLYKPLTGSRWVS